MSVGELDSREFKIMLRETRFGEPADLRSNAREFWEELERRAEDADVATLRSDPDFGDEVEREVEFFDTAAHAIKTSDYALRRRWDPAENQTKITLKKRHADRVLAFHNGISRRQAERRNTTGQLKRKFEEDVKPFGNGKQRSLFSHSLSWTFDGEQPAECAIDDGSGVERLFPGFVEAVPVGEQMLGPITPALREIVLESDKRIRFDRDKDANVEGALVAWYSEDETQPGVVEFSFRYEDDDVDSPGAAHGAAALLQILAGMDWCDPEGLTKTQWVYLQA